MRRGERHINVPITSRFGHATDLDGNTSDAAQSHARQEAGRSTFCDAPITRDSPVGAMRECFRRRDSGAVSIDSVSCERGGLR